MQPKRFIGRPVNADDHRVGPSSRLDIFTPLGDQLAVAGEHDCLGRLGWDVYRDAPPTVVTEGLGDQPSPGCAAGRFRIHSQDPPIELQTQMKSCTQLIHLRAAGATIPMSQPVQIDGHACLFGRRGIDNQGSHRQRGLSTLVVMPQTADFRKEFDELRCVKAEHLALG